MAKVVLSRGRAFAMAPARAQDTIEMGTPALVMNVLPQVLIGLGMGFVTYLLFTAVAVAGSLIDMFGGFAMAQAFVPLAMNRITVFGKFPSLLAPEIGRAACRKRGGQYV